MNTATSRRFTIVDGMILIAALAISFWVSRYGLIAWVAALIGGFDSQVWAANPVHLSWHWGSLFLRHTQPAAAVLTLTVLTLRLLPPRPRMRRLARQPGFTACSAAMVAILIGGLLNYTTTKVVPAPGFELQVYIQLILMPQGSEPGLAIAACWLALTIGGRWRPERSWIDRLGRLLGVYWLLMMVFAPFSTQL